MSDFDIYRYGDSTAGTVLLQMVDDHDMGFLEQEAELIRDNREGKFIFYELNASVLEEILLWITELKGE